jgi:phosphonatase-like hydrolase
VTRLVVIDMAGTTVADGGLVEAAFVEAMAAVGIPPDDPSMADRLAHVHRTMGQSKIVVFRHLLGDDDLARDALAAFETSVRARIDAGQVSALPGAEEAFDRLRAAGRKVCLTTGFSAATQDAILDHLRWRDRVDLALCPDDRHRGRPHPDLVLRAVLAFHLDDVRHAAVVGDTANDLHSGWAAGAGLVIGVLTGAHDRATLQAAPHTHLVESVADVPDLVLGTARRPTTFAQGSHGDDRAVTRRP